MLHGGPGMGLEKLLYHLSSVGGDSCVFHQQRHMLYCTLERQRCGFLIGPVDLRGKQMEYNQFWRFPFGIPMGDIKSAIVVFQMTSKMI
jgi:hypothetical protein